MAFSVQSFVLCHSRSTLALRLCIGVEVGRHHEPVAMVKRIDDGAEPAMVVGRENARGQGVENALEIGLGIDGSRRIVALPPPGFDLLGGQSEDEDVVPAHMFEDLDIGAIQRADGQRAIERELHVAGAGGFHAGRRDLLREICRRNDHFRQADIVVRDEDDLQDVADGRIVFTTLATSLASLMMSLAWA